MLGILLVHKEAGCTSHDVVNAVREKFGTRRVGHAGTLDPAATGILVVAVGAATRFLQYLPLEPKEYHAKIRFGQETRSYDTEGEVVAETDVPGDLVERVYAILPSFLGRIEQLPPMFSAVKVHGKPLYKYARSGQELKREPREVRIDVFDILGGVPPILDFRIVCSGGTYVRSLAHDLGVAVKCGAHLAGLERVAVGRFTLDEALPLSELNPSHLIPLAKALPPMPLVPLERDQVRFVQDGRAILMDHPLTSTFAGLVDEGGGVFAVARVYGNVLKPECVIPGEALYGSN